mmetsp:Transcript_53750/g.73682  ORF Transcript_53750/g.73682 Transcript_53750/m.73682 type:complete len:205 (-) Transcript_53750:243-857(-)
MVCSHRGLLHGLVPDLRGLHALRVRPLGPGGGGQRAEELRRGQQGSSSDVGGDGAVRHVLLPADLRDVQGEPLRHDGHRREERVRRQPRADRGARRLQLRVPRHRLRRRLPGHGHLRRHRQLRDHVHLPGPDLPPLAAMRQGLRRQGPAAGRKLRLDLCGEFGECHRDQRHNRGRDEMSRLTALLAAQRLRTTRQRAPFFIEQP